MMVLKSATTILFAFAAILLLGCRDSDELRSARLAEARADEAIALFKEDIAELEIQVGKLVKENEILAQTNKKLRQENMKLAKELEDVKKETLANKAKSKENEILVQANKKLRQYNFKLAKQLEDVRKEILANESKKAVVPKKQSVPKRLVQKWYEGGTLHNKSALEWQMASAEDKLATCSDFVAITWKEQKFISRIQNSIDSVDSMKIHAAQLVIYLDAATERFADPEQNRRVYANQTVSGLTMFGMVAMGWLK